LYGFPIEGGIAFFNIQSFRPNHPSCLVSILYKFWGLFLGYLGFFQYPCRCGTLGFCGVLHPRHSLRTGRRETRGNRNLDGEVIEQNEKNPVEKKLLLKLLI